MLVFELMNYILFSKWFPIKQHFAPFSHILWKHACQSTSSSETKNKFSDWKIQQQQPSRNIIVWENKISLRWSSEQCKRIGIRLRKFFLEIVGFHSLSSSAVLWHGIDLTNITRAVGGMVMYLYIYMLCRKRIFNVSSLHINLMLDKNK